MKFKKIAMLIVAATMIAGLAACGSTGNTNPATAENDSAQLEETDADKDADDANETATEDKKDSKPKGSKPSFDDSGVIEETVLYDQEGVKITATGLEYSPASVSLLCTIENNTEENLGFVAESIGYACNAVNGYMINDGYVNEDVTAGNKANTEVSFSKDELLIHGITSIADIQVGFSISDPDYDSIHTGPLKVTTNLAESYDYEKDTYIEAVKGGILEIIYGGNVQFFNDEEIYNSDGVRIVSAGLLSNNDGNQGFMVEYVNDTDYVIYAVSEKVGLNGLNIYDSDWSNSMLNPHCRAVEVFTMDNLIDENTRKLVGIDEINELSYDVSLRDEDYEEFSAAQPIVVADPKGNSGFSAKGTEVYNGNGIKISTIGIADDDLDYSSRKHLLLLVEYTGENNIRLADTYDSLSVNGFMTDYFAYDKYLTNGDIALYDLEIDGDSLEGNGITDISQIENVQMGFEITDWNYNDIDEITVTLMGE